MNESSTFAQSKISSQFPANPSQLIVALDYDRAEDALSLAKTLQPLGITFKVGMQLFYNAGYDILTALNALHCPLFVDLKLHDIPNTVAQATRALICHGVHFLNVHTTGGQEMMRSAAQAGKETARKMGRPEPIIVGVTLLTSLDQQALQHDLQVETPVDTYVPHLAKLAQNSGLDGVVCSAWEAPQIQAACGSEFVLVTPGIRPQGGASHDQSRIVTPKDAIHRGAHYIVVGRPITAADNPLTATERILNEMQ